MAPYNSKGRTDARALTKTGQRTSVPARRRLGEGLVAGWAHLLSAVVRTVRYDGTLAQPSPPFWDKRWPRPRQLILIQLRLSRQSRRKPSADTAPPISAPWVFSEPLRRPVDAGSPLPAPASGPSHEGQTAVLASKQTPSLDAPVPASPSPRPRPQASSARGLFFIPALDDGTGMA